MKILISFLLIISIAVFANAQTVKLLTGGTKTSLRGLSVVSDNLLWVSGNNGTVAKSIDAGITWKWMTVKGFEKMDFRDIEAFDANTALIMAIAEPAYILKTTDGGETWNTVYKSETKGMFLDAMDFSNNRNGVVIGDPIMGRFFIARTADAGNTWQEELFANRPIADSGEAFFASSGTNIRKLKNGNEVFVSGGFSSHFYDGKIKTLIPFMQGKETAGGNSIAVKNKNIIMVVGGNFNTKDSTTKNCFITKDGGKEWDSPLTPPTGYRSCIEYVGNNKWITCGLNGVDISTNNGQVFKRIDDQSFNVCKKAKTGKSIYMAGANGKIGKIIL